MSTWIYLKCLDHDPPIRSDHESGQHLYDLPQLREDLRNRDQLLLDRDEPFTYFTANTVWFLRGHPKCRISIEDEYGDEHPLEED